LSYSNINKKQWFGSSNAKSTLAFLTSLRYIDNSTQFVGEKY
jgi:hypothetical protein